MFISVPIICQSMAVLKGDTPAFDRSLSLNEVNTFLKAVTEFQLDDSLCLTISFVL